MFEKLNPRWSLTDGVFVLIAHIDKDVLQKDADTIEQRQ
jgi:hypothetical protein